MSISTPYGRLGASISALRAKKALKTQADLAAILGASQQAVSRWEKGSSRPREADLRRLARVLEADEAELFEAAGYAPTSTPVTLSFDRALPVNGLSPDTFERFCVTLLECLYRPSGGQVHQAGGTGHTQDGIDIVATGPFGKHVFQCKRVDEFGPAKVRTAVEKVKMAAECKVLLLSNIASPPARAVLEGLPDWDIWDREDISRKARDLPHADQIRLIDTFFRGQRRQLLGVPEAGPIITADEFFAPYLHAGRLFTHTWALVGRSKELDLLRQALEDESVWLTMMVGPPGGGKSRILRELVEELRHESADVLFASPTEDVTSMHLHSLGNGKKLLVVDDAHEREDIAALVYYCADPAHQTRLLLTLRPYGRERIKFQAAGFSLTGPNIREIAIERPSIEDAQELARQVLEACGGPQHAAQAVANATHRSPLVTVIAAQIVARDKIALPLLGNVADFETTVLSRFQDVIAGEIASGQDRERLPAVLRIACLLQPIMPDDPSLLQIIERMENVQQSDSVRILKILVDSGLLFRRGVRYRVSPDLLADSVIQRYCIAPDGSSTGYAEKVFDIAQPQQLTNLLTNVGRLDWRLHDGDPENSRFLDGLWSRLHWMEDYFNPHLEAAASVAYYQPRRALDFAAQLVRDGRGSDDKVCQIIRHVAYNHDFLREACELLWHAGQDDPRPLHQQPNHGIRLLKELAEYEPNKPGEYVETVVDFALELAADEQWLKGAHTPFEILEGTLSTEGHTTSATSRRAITLRAYAADLNVVGRARQRVIEALLTFVGQGTPRQAFLAVRSFAQALRSPMGILGMQISDMDRQPWQASHQVNIERLREVLENVRVHPAVLVRAAESVSWHAIYGPEQNSGVARQIISMLNRDFDTRIVRALMDGWGHSTRAIQVDTTDRPPHEIEMDQLIHVLKERFTAESLFEYLLSTLSDLGNVTGGETGAPHILIQRLIREFDGLASMILERQAVNRAGSLKFYAGVAMAVALEQGISRQDSGLRSMAWSDEELQLLAQGYSWRDPTSEYSDTDIAALRAIFSSRDLEVVRHTGNIALQVSKRDKPLAIELICMVDLTLAERARHDVFMWLCHGKTIPSELVSQKQLVQLVGNLALVAELDDYWVRKFLKRAMRVVPESVIAMLQSRLQRAVDEDDWSISPLGRPHNPENDLALLSVEGGGRIFLSLLEWAMHLSEDGSALYRFGGLMGALCGNVSEEMLDLMLRWMIGGTVRQAEVVASVVREGQSTMVYAFPGPVRALLNASYAIGKEALDAMSSALFAATISGVRSTSPGEPFPEDLRLRDHAQQVLSTLGRMDPAYDLFRQLLKSANDGIAMQLRDKRAMDAEEEDAE